MKSIINHLKKSEKWKNQLTAAINVIFSKETDNPVKE